MSLRRPCKGMWLLLQRAGRSPCHSTDSAPAQQVCADCCCRTTFLQCPQVVRVLLSAGAEVSGPNNYSMRLLRAAAALDSEEASQQMLKMLLDAGASIRTDLGHGQYSTLLHKAAQQGSLLMLQRLLVAGCSLGKWDDSSAPTQLHSSSRVTNPPLSDSMLARTLTGA